MPRSQGFRVTIRVVPPPGSYPSKCRNGIRSRPWQTLEDLSRHGPKAKAYSVSSVLMVTESGCRELSKKSVGFSPSEPTFVPTTLERVVSSKGTVSDKRSKVIREVTVQYNLCNEPWLKYHLSQVADRGLKLSQWTSSRLRREVLYMESHSSRYELAWEGDPSSPDAYRLSKCKSILELDRMQKVGIPHPPEEMEVLVSMIPWESFRWGTDGLTVEGRHVPVVRVQWLPRSKEMEVAGA